MLAFLGLSAAAIAVYPGGTFWDHGALGHSFWQNYLCDLTQSPALNGNPNANGARLASLGMLALVCALVAFVGLVPSLLREAQQITRQIKVIAGLACGLGAFVPLLPSDRFGALHAATVFAAGIPVTLGLLSLVSILRRQTELGRWLRTLSAFLCVAVVGCLALYAAEVCFDAAPMRMVPILARLANLALVAWLIGLSRVVRGRVACERAS